MPPTKRTIQETVLEYIEHYGPVNVSAAASGLMMDERRTLGGVARLFRKGLVVRVERGVYDVEGQRQTPVFPRE